MTTAAEGAELTRVGPGTAMGALIAALRAKDAAALAGLAPALLQAGSSEIRNWICAAGALEHLSVTWVEYQPGYRTPAGTGTAMCFAHWA